MTMPTKESIAAWMFKAQGDYTTAEDLAEAAARCHLPTEADAGLDCDHWVFAAAEAIMSVVA
jgi:hypothetical protein